MLYCGQYTVVFSVLKGGDAADATEQDRRAKGRLYGRLLVEDMDRPQTI